MNRARGVCLIVAVLALIFSVCEADAKSKNDGNQGTLSGPPPNLNTSEKARSSNRNSLGTEIKNTDGSQENLRNKPQANRKASTTSGSPSRVRRTPRELRGIGIAGRGM